MKRLPRITVTAAVLPTVLAGLMIVCPAAAAAESAHGMYTTALARERQLRDESSGATVLQLRRTVQAYEAVVRRFPTSGYSDNALWQGANLALMAFERFSDPADRKTAVRLFTHLKDQYPASPLVPRAAEILQQLDVRAATTEHAAGPPPPPPPVPALPSAAPAVSSGSSPGGGAGSRAPAPSADAASEPGLVTIRGIKRTPLPDGVRVSIEVDGESLFRSERLENPKRVFFDLKGTRATGPLQDATLKFTDNVVREIRLGRHPNRTTRVVMDMEAVESYSVFTLYNPFRIVVDFRRSGAVPGAATLLPAAAVPAVSTNPAPSGTPGGAAVKTVPAGKDPVPMISRPGSAPLISPAAPAVNSNGQFSLARQLGLGVSRIVLDAGHGGHDPGARANGVNEAELVLDVTLRLRELLDKQPGIEVTLTRDTDEFIPLEERTEIANRRGADLFLSIHANASRNPRARGIETYFLNFASNPEAEAVAARENSASGRSMRNLPDILRAIALNNKIDESRDFADMVQKSMIHRLGTRNAQVRDLGVKQAPFVVLIGAGMPSVLAEISFVTNKQEAANLKTGVYRQQIAESLFDAIMRYQRSLKGVRAVAAKE